MINNGRFTDHQRTGRCATPAKRPCIARCRVSTRGHAVQTTVPLLPLLCPTAGSCTSTNRRRKLTGFGKQHRMEISWRWITHGVGLQKRCQLWLLPELICYAKDAKLSAFILPHSSPRMVSRLPSRPGEHSDPRRPKNKPSLNPSMNFTVASPADQELYIFYINGITSILSA